MTVKKFNVPVLDSLRAFAALSVCFYHFVCTTTGYINTEWILGIFSWGRFGVQLFFVISGFVIPWAMDRAGYHFSDFFSFLLKRLTRLEPPYIVSLALAIAILMMRDRLIGPSEHLQPITFTRVALHFGYLIPFFSHFAWINQVYWTLAVEFQYYLFIALIFIPLTRWGIIARIVIYIAFLIAGQVENSSFLPHWLPVFLIGILLFLFKSEKIKRLEYYLVSGLVFLYCLFRYDVGEVMFIAIAILMILRFPNLELKTGDFFGKISYSMYLIHPIIGATLINVLSHHVTHPIGKVLVILAGLLVTVLGAWVMYLVVEKPSKRLSSSITYRKSSSSVAAS